jgi:tetratricopeptide (TPR) repeat protein
MTGADVQTVEGLGARHPQEPTLAALSAAVFVSRAAEERESRHYTEALSLLRRAIALRSAERAPRAALVDTLLGTGDWPAAEAAARELLALAPGDAFAFRSLGLALMRQDRNREAVEALQASLEAEDDPAARATLQRIQKGLRDEEGMSEKHLAHFNVRYDGEAHEDVGREILRALERHYATLVSLLDHQPSATIPVVLFSQEAYYDAAGAPRWSGGAYNHLDGRIRIPIGGLSPSLTADMDHVLIHELTHAFVSDRSRGTCPHDVHEGLAQYMEGRRIASELDRDQLRMLADGRLGGVGGFYLSALALVEYLTAQRGQGGLNDLLKAMGDTGDSNLAFRQVYGKDYLATARAARQRLKQQYGG